MAAIQEADYQKQIDNLTSILNNFKAEIEAKRFAREQKKAEREAKIKAKADAALAASIFHFNQYSIGEVKEYLKENNVAVRL